MAKWFKGETAAARLLTTIGMWLSRFGRALVVAATAHNSNGSSDNMLGKSSHGTHTADRNPPDDWRIRTAGVPKEKWIQWDNSNVLYKIASSGDASAAQKPSSGESALRARDPIKTGRYAASEKRDAASPAVAQLLHRKEGIAQFRSFVRNKKPRHEHEFFFDAMRYMRSNVRSFVVDPVTSVHKPLAPHSARAEPKNSQRLPKDATTNFTKVVRRWVTTRIGLFMRNRKSGRDHKHFSDAVRYSQSKTRSLLADRVTAFGKPSVPDLTRDEPKSFQRLKKSGDTSVNKSLSPFNNSVPKSVLDISKYSEGTSTFFSPAFSSSPRQTHPQEITSRVPQHRLRRPLYFSYFRGGLKGLESHELQDSAVRRVDRPTLSEKEELRSPPSGDDKQTHSVRYMEVGHHIPRAPFRVLDSSGLQKESREAITSSNANHPSAVLRRTLQSRFAAQPEFEDMDMTHRWPDLPALNENQPEITLSSELSEFNRLRRLDLEQRGVTSWNASLF